MDVGSIDITGQRMSTARSTVSRKVEAARSHESSNPDAPRLQEFITMHVQMAAPSHGDDLCLSGGRNGRV
jgi:hypothetical protein